jgi:hypothetical protein
MVHVKGLALSDPLGGAHTVPLNDVPAVQTPFTKDVSSTVAPFLRLNVVPPAATNTVRPALLAADERVDPTFTSTRLGVVAFVVDHDADTVQVLAPDAMVQEAGVVRLPDTADGWQTEPFHSVPPVQPPVTVTGGARGVVPSRISIVLSPRVHG